MPRPPPVTLTMTWGARRTVASMRLRIAVGPALAAQAGRPRLDDPVPGVEEALAPLDEDAVDRWIASSWWVPGSLADETLLGG